MHGRTDPPADDGDAAVNDPLLTTPAARLMALAMGTDIRVFDLPAARSAGLAGLVGVSSGEDAEPRCMIGLSDDLDDDLRADVLGFGLAVLVGTPEILENSPDGVLGISRQRLPQADSGPGNLAWHMVRTCGRESPSTTFQLMIIQSDEQASAVITSDRHGEDRTMGLGISRIRHVKLPVGDLRRSVAWYQALLGLQIAAEFSEQGVVRGVQLTDPDGGFAIALRDRRFCAGQPDLRGFDVFALEVDSVASLHALAARCEELGFEHSGVADRGEYGANLDVPDPDGTVLRFLANNIINPGSFLGLDVDANGRFSFYDGPRLTSG
jgi:catechol 2,3-dioxygenase-like lactoylglutathione lyase family enzyme